MAQKKIICICVYRERKDNKADVVTCQHLGNLNFCTACDFSVNMK